MVKTGRVGKAKFTNILLSLREQSTIRLISIFSFIYKEFVFKYHLCKKHHFSYDLIPNLTEMVSGAFFCLCFKSWETAEPPRYCVPPSMSNLCLDTGSYRGWKSAQLRNQDQECESCTTERQQLTPSKPNRGGKGLIFLSGSLALLIFLSMISRNKTRILISPCAPALKNTHIL